MHQTCAILRLKARHRQLERLAGSLKSVGLSQWKREIGHELKPAVETLHNWLRLSRPPIGDEVGVVPAGKFASLECLVGFTNRQTYVALHQIREWALMLYTLVEMNRAALAPMRLLAKGTMQALENPLNPFSNTCLLYTSPSPRDA